jgi:hypothetical protein
MFEWHKKEKPVFTGIARGVGGFGFGGAAAVSAAAGAFAATGGNVDGLAPGNGYKYHTFTSPGTFIVSGSPGIVEILMVAGGGGGGVLAGGGGAGGLVYGPAIPLAVSTYNVTVGQGGAGPTGFFGSSGSPGTATIITNGSYTITANGGGGSRNQGEGYAGGSGGGAGQSSVPNIGPGNQPSANPGVSGILQYGFPGGLGEGSSPTDRGGGGGGAGEAGHSRSSPTPARGGDGRQYPAFTGSLIGVPALSPLNGYFAGGGGGGSRSDSYGLAARPGGLGGGGTGETSTTAGVTNSGSGGGAGSYPDVPVGKAGGPGILIIRYLA